MTNVCLALVVAYAAMNVAYTLRLKGIVILDMSMASGVRGLLKRGSGSITVRGGWHRPCVGPPGSPFQLVEENHS